MDFMTILPLSLAMGDGPTTPKEPLAATQWPPELDDAEYFREVLHGAEGGTEADLDRKMEAQAAEMGLDSPPLHSRPPTAEAAPAMVEVAAAQTSLPNNSILAGPSEPQQRHLHRYILHRARTASTSSNSTASTALTSRGSWTAMPATLTESSLSSGFFTSNACGARLSAPGYMNNGSAQATPRASSRVKSLTFSQYEKYISHVDPNLGQPRLAVPHAAESSTLNPARPEREKSIFSISTRLGIKTITRKLAGWRIKGKRPRHAPVVTVSCVCCREDFPKDHNSLQTLPCGHMYCEACLTVMIKHSMADESKMPPRCCTQPIPSSIIKAILSRDEQQVFLKAVMQYSTPWEAKILCPQPTCGGFIPPRGHLDPKHPFVAICQSCKTRVCVMCKRSAHRIGQDCPEDWELEAVLRMGERSGWQRCYKCRTLVELSQGCTHMTCRCKAQFCYICGAVWDLTVGCPNFCNGEEELERRHMEEEARIAELEAEKQAQEEAAAKEAAERQAAELRTQESTAFSLLRTELEEEQARFITFYRKTRWLMWVRQSNKKLQLVERYTDLREKTKERHAKKAQHLEDRQVEAEHELRTSFEHQKKSISIKLKHMEAYCNALGRSTNQDQPLRKVTQRNLEALAQQYHVQDGIKRRHDAQINVLREKQARCMEELMERQNAELVNLDDKRARDIGDLMAEFANEENMFIWTFEERGAKMRRRWALAVGIMCLDLEQRHGLKFSPIALPEWSIDVGNVNDPLSVVTEEDCTPTESSA